MNSRKILVIDVGDPRICPGVFLQLVPRVEPVQSPVQVVIDQIREALASNLFPLIVSEGTSTEKMARIQHSNYLGRSYRSFAKIGGTLYIYGFAMGANDEHWLRLIQANRSLKKLFVGLYGDPATPAIQQLVQRAVALQEARSVGKFNLPVGFFDAATAKVWG